MYEMRKLENKKLLLIVIVVLVAIGASECASLIKSARQERAAVGPRWSLKQIPYAFSNIIEFEIPDRELIKTVLKEIETSLSIDGELCIEFVERNNEKDYILFVDKGDCSSGVGFLPGVNNISLGRRCLEKGTIIHEVMHRLGFDHEHSRHDRDENVEILFNNTDQLQNNNFELNHGSKDLQAPYDFHSVIHYDSNAMQNKNNRPTIVSKIPVLISETNEIYHSREKLTPIDIYKIQRFYKCNTIPIPEIVKEQDSIEENKIEKINQRFRIEAQFDGITDELIDQYLAKTYESCGVEHYWPLNYPLVETKHRLYKLMCSRKKAVKERCRFSIECQDELAVCVRPFYIKTGFCVRPENETLNRMTQVVNDSMFKFGRKVKDTAKKIKIQLFG